jgi:hypothetical protein
MGGSIAQYFHPEGCQLLLFKAANPHVMQGIVPFYFSQAQSFESGSFKGRNRSPVIRLDKGVHSSYNCLAKQLFYSPLNDQSSKTQAAFTLFYTHVNLRFVSALQIEAYLPHRQISIIYRDEYKTV